MIGIDIVTECFQIYFDVLSTTPQQMCTRITSAAPTTKFEKEKKRVIMNIYFGAVSFIV